MCQAGHRRTRPSKPAKPSQRAERIGSRTGRLRPSHLPARRRPHRQRSFPRRVRYSGHQGDRLRTCRRSLRHGQDSDWANWPFYIDVAEDGSSDPTTLEKFTKSTGIQVTYTEDVNDNDEYFAKIQPQLSGGQAIAADTFVVTDWMVGKLIRLGFLEELDHSNIPNLKNLRTDLNKVSYDPGRKYSVTWQSGLAGIAVNPAATGGKEVTSMDQLLTDPALRGKVTLLTEMRDTVGLTMLDLGYDPADFTMDQFDQAIAKLQKSVDSGQIRRFTGNDYGADLVQGNVAACTAGRATWSACRPTRRIWCSSCRMPAARLWSDNFVIPIRTPHKKNAETLINFYYDPEIAAQVEDYVNYISPVVGTAVAMKELDPDLLKNELGLPHRGNAE